MKHILLTLDSMGRTQKCDHSLESCRAVLYRGAVLFFNRTQIVILENLTILDLVLSGVKGLNPLNLKLDLLFQLLTLYVQLLVRTCKALNLFISGGKRKVILFGSQFCVCGQIKGTQHIHSFQVLLLRTHRF